MGNGGAAAWTWPSPPAPSLCSSELPLLTPGSHLHECDMRQARFTPAASSILLLCGCVRSLKQQLPGKEGKQSGARLCQEVTRLQKGPS